MPAWKLGDSPEHEMEQEEGPQGRHMHHEDMIGEQVGQGRGSD